MIILFDLSKLNFCFAKTFVNQNVCRDRHQLFTLINCISKKRTGGINLFIQFSVCISILLHSQKDNNN